MYWSTIEGWTSGLRHCAVQVLRFDDYGTWGLSDLDVLLADRRRIRVILYSRLDLVRRALEMQSAEKFHKDRVTEVRAMQVPLTVTSVAKKQSCNPKACSYPSLPRLPSCNRGPASSIAYTHTHTAVTPVLRFPSSGLDAIAECTSDASPQKRGLAITLAQLLIKETIRSIRTIEPASSSCLVNPIICHTGAAQILSSDRPKNHPANPQ